MTGLSLVSDGLGRTEGVSHEICEIVQKRVARLHKTKPLESVLDAYMRCKAQKRNAPFRHICTWIARVHHGNLPRQL